jgi:release factor glutamine methyltransferase
LSAAVKYIVGSTWQPFLRKYLSKTRKYRYKNIRLQVPSSVFHPGFFFSTHLLLEQIKGTELKNKKLLEPGAGSGLISIYAAQKGAIVTATDINPVAVECLKENSRENNVHIEILRSDLFDQIPVQLFDIIVINPPYYKKDPESFSDYAWNCGSNGEYFRKLFGQLRGYIHLETKILMVLCDGCDMEMIKDLARENGYHMQLVFSKKNMIEKNFIYSIEPYQ